MHGPTLRGAFQLAIGVVIAALVLQTWLALGWIVPVTVAGSSMAPTLLGPHRAYFCPACRYEFVVGLDQLPRDDAAVCPNCGRHTARAVAGSDRPGERLTIDRRAFDRRGPRRWEAVVFRCPQDASQLCVKRVVGLPGETVALDGGDVVINGQIARKSLVEQRALRQIVCGADDESIAKRVRVGNVWIAASPRWQRVESGRLEYHHFDNGPITDECGYNQGISPPANPVADIMLTFSARLSGAGRLTVVGGNRFGRSELAVEFEPREVALRIDQREVSRRRLPAKVATGVDFDEWTFSLFDRQALLAIGDEVLLAIPWENDERAGTAADSPLSLGINGLAGEIRSLTVWRDVYYGVRQVDGRQPGVVRGTVPIWRLGAAEYFVVGDNASVSDDSRSWFPSPGLDAKLLVGKPLGVR